VGTLDGHQSVIDSEVLSVSAICRAPGVEVMSSRRYLMPLPWRNGSSIRRLVPLGCLSLILLSVGLAVFGDGTAAPAVQPALEGNRGPYKVAFTPDGQRA